MTNNMTVSSGTQPDSPNDLSAQKAWKLWLNLTSMADLLWESYQNQFLSFCMRDIDLKKVNVEKLPFE